MSSECAHSNTCVSSTVWWRGFPQGWVVVGKCSLCFCYPTPDLDLVDISRCAVNDEKEDDAMRSIDYKKNNEYNFNY